MRWYGDQKASSTKFISVEHRRDIHGPFYHEFLLFKLIDGAMCRLERVGEGSRADAIRYTGCTANDLIQWLNADDYAKFESENPSVLLSEVTFPSEYDILDVLAICYSIQNTQACKVYTLQRYNCYFLCLTVLAVLTRRAASWEDEITDHVWDSALGFELGRLSSLSAEEVKEIPMLRACAMLEPNDPHCSRPLLEELRSQLHSGSQIAGETREAVRSALWAFPWESETLVIESIASRVSPLIIDEEFSPSRLRSVLTDGLQNPDQSPVSNNAVVEFCKEEWLKQGRHVLLRWDQHFSNSFQMMEIEQPIPFRTMVLSRVAQFCLIMLVMANGPAITESCDTEVRMMLGIETKTSNSKLSDILKLMGFFSGYVGYGAALSAIEGDKYKKLLDEAVDIHIAGHIPLLVTSVLNTLGSEGMLEQEASIKPVLAYMLNTTPRYPLERAFASSTLLSTLKNIFQGQPEHLRVKSWVR
ncbi:hypothetical protein FRC10_006475 [Ceratobasidium sp. 414]|nr:hypothetical protein FRC10_006475 [Ceratobasidium sp. 414]